MNMAGLPGENISVCIRGVFVLKALHPDVLFTLPLEKCEKMAKVYSTKDELSSKCAMTPQKTESVELMIHSFSILVEGR